MDWLKGYCLLFLACAGCVAPYEARSIASEEVARRLQCELPRIRQELNARCDQISRMVSGQRGLAREPAMALEIQRAGELQRSIGQLTAEIQALSAEARELREEVAALKKENSEIKAIYIRVTRETVSWPGHPKRDEELSRFEQAMLRLRELAEQRARDCP